MTPLHTTAVPHSNPRDVHSAWALQTEEGVGVREREGEGVRVGLVDATAAGEREDEGVRVRVGVGVRERDGVRVAEEARVEEALGIGLDVRVGVREEEAGGLRLGVGVREELELAAAGLRVAVTLLVGEGETVDALYEVLGNPLPVIVIVRLINPRLLDLPAGTT